MGSYEKLSELLSSYLLKLYNFLSIHEKPEILREIRPIGKPFLYVLKGSDAKYVLTQKAKIIEENREFEAILNYLF